MSELTGLMTPLIIAAVPIVVLGLKKWVLPANRPWMFPLIATVLGSVADVLGAVATAGVGPKWYGVVTGLATVGLREIVDQLKKATGTGGSQSRRWAIAFLFLIPIATACTAADMIQVGTATGLVREKEMIPVPAVGVRELVAEAYKGAIEENTWALKVCEESRRLGARCTLSLEECAKQEARRRYLTTTKVQVDRVINTPQYEINPEEAVRLTKELIVLARGSARPI